MAIANTVEDKNKNPNAIIFINNSNLGTSGNDFGKLNAYKTTATQASSMETTNLIYILNAILCTIY
jgi:hypothetical protein